MLLVCYWRWTPPRRRSGPATAHITGIGDTCQILITHQIPHINIASRQPGRWQLAVKPGKLKEKEGTGEVSKKIHFQAKYLKILSNSNYYCIVIYLSSNMEIFSNKFSVLTNDHLLVTNMCGGYIYRNPIL